MRIISTLLPAAPEELLEGRKTVVMALDAFVDDKPLVVGITVGRLDGPTLEDVAVSKPGQLIIDRCGRHMQLNYAEGAVVVAGVASVAGAKQRVRKVLADAPPKAFVLLVCASNKVYDAALPALEINLQAVNLQAQ